MLVRGKIVGEKFTAPFEILKTGDGISLRVELPGEPFEYSTDCHCLEPLELLGLLLPAIEEEIGEIKGVFVEDVEEKRSVFERVRGLLRKTF
ncbi:hypothetical protein APY94_00795 [Thermococcus celericrescens]|uniref:Uncharacterized protein n=1 Tax=Thermococcus celericrescens TaxID=227598 RepID=A0A100XZT0_9EURY|nr:hypothetical protein [Thermococcus celericrescens]KUH34748.1 hypothetical protein APY94_00795 [Thermococcus celericrescens]